LSLLQKALRQAPDGLPQVSRFIIARILHEAGLSWQKSRTWCQTGAALRRRKDGLVRVSDPDAPPKKADRSAPWRTLCPDQSTTCIASPATSSAASNGIPR